MCLISLICITLFSFFGTEWVKSLSSIQAPLTVCVCVCACMCVWLAGGGEGETSQRLPCYVSSLLSRSGGSQSHLILTSEG